MKLLCKAVTATAKLYVVCVFVNELAYLNNEVRELRREVDTLKSTGKG